jgi:hypothetical protein
MIDEEEIVKALSLEEKALDEFKRKRTSNSHSQNSFSRSFEGKIGKFCIGNNQQVKFHNFYH